MIDPRLLGAVTLSPDTHIQRGVISGAQVTVLAIAAVVGAVVLHHEYRGSSKDGIVGGLVVAAAILLTSAANRHDRT